MASTASPQHLQAQYSQDEATAFWVHSPEDWLRTLGCSNHGLTSSEAEKRLARFGLNADRKGQRETALHAILRRLLEPLSLILFGAGLVSIATGDAIGGAIIVAILAISIGLDTFQEGHATRAAEALRRSVALDRDAGNFGGLEQPAGDTLPVKDMAEDAAQLFPVERTGPCLEPLEIGARCLR